MKKIKPGSVRTSEQNPKLIWVSLINKPHYQKIMTLRRKFNEILEYTLATYNQCYILHAMPILKHEFNRDNELSVNGKISLWKDIDEQLNKFNLQDPKVKLKSKKLADQYRSPNQSQADQLKHQQPRKSLPSSPQNKAKASGEDFAKRIENEAKEFKKLHQRTKHKRSRSRSKSPHYKHKHYPSSKNYRK